MRRSNSLFIIIVGLAFVSAFLAYEPRLLLAARDSLSKAGAALPPMILNPVAQVFDGLLPDQAHPPAEPTAALAGARGRIVRIPAIREAANYGWIQLPHGTRVDFVEERRDGLLIRYDDSFVLIPRAAVEDGSVVLRKLGGSRAS